MSTPTPVNVLAPIQKLQAILALIPQINGVILNSFAQINQILPSAGLPSVSAATLAAVNQQISDAIKVVGDLGVEANDLLGVFTNFATNISTLVASFHAAQAQAAVVPTKTP